MFVAKKKRGERLHDETTLILHLLFILPSYNQVLIPYAIFDGNQYKLVYRLYLYMVHCFPVESNLFLIYLAETNDTYSRTQTNPF